MNKLKKFISKNAYISEYTKEYDAEENIYFYEAIINITFKNKYYCEKIFSSSHNIYNKDYKNELIDKITNKIIFDLGLLELNKIDF